MWTTSSETLLEDFLLSQNAFADPECDGASPYLFSGNFQIFGDLVCWKSLGCPIRSTEEGDAGGLQGGNSESEGAVKEIQSQLDWT